MKENPDNTTSAGSIFIEYGMKKCLLRLDMNESSPTLINKNHHLFDGSQL